MQVEVVKDLDVFLEKSEYGINHVYQLHRELGEVFVDASFQDESQSLLFKTRIPVDPPKFVASTLRWNESGFPYELETYQVDGGKDVVVSLYRQFNSSAWHSFLLDVAEELVDLIKDETIPSSGFVVPTSLVEGLRKSLRTTQEIVDFLKSKREHLNDEECRAIDTYFGEVGIWDRLDDDMCSVIATYLHCALRKQQESYENICNLEIKNRHGIFVEVENQTISRLENTLKEHGFKKGFVSS